MCFVQLLLKGVKKKIKLFTVFFTSFSAPFSSTLLHSSPLSTTGGHELDKLTPRALSSLTDLHAPMMARFSWTKVSHIYSLLDFPPNIFYRPYIKQLRALLHFMVKTVIGR